MSFRLAAYAVCIEDGRVLLAHHVGPRGERNWTLPGGKVERSLRRGHPGGRRGDRL
ncbi:NUDIX domain-containing protein [Nonomuraea dietziae]|uniref:NUDIX domain-containing protein n=1 Tax=Nonomuraea dietziae TaxID=65515 RepID=UPI0031E2AE7E